VAKFPLPTRRQVVTGVSFDGERVELRFSISKQLYRCPACRRSIPIGTEHIVVRIKPTQEAGYHQHWHQECVRPIVRELRNITTKPVG
jgi:hypothetical protein